MEKNARFFSIFNFSFVMANEILGSTTFQVIQTSDTNKLVRGLEILKRLQKQIEHCRVETLCVT